MANDMVCQDCPVGCLQCVKVSDTNIYCLKCDTGYYLQQFDSE